MDARENILVLFTTKPGISTKDISKLTGKNVRTIQRVIKIFKEGNKLQNETRGRKKGYVDKKIEQKVLHLFKKNPCLSVRDISKKLSVSASLVQKIKKKNNLKAFKKTIIPKRSEKQQKVAITRARKLYQKVLAGFDGCVVMDDETYTKMDFKTIPGHNFFTAKTRDSVEGKFKNIETEKFGEKVLIWQTICSCGKRSEPFIQKGTINSVVYVNECLQKRLLPFLRKHTIPTIFWPDLATCHYSKLTTKWYNDNGVNFVRKVHNPPNCPMLRPIEKYWAHIKAKLKKTSKSTKSIGEFKKEWLKATKTITDSSVQTLMSGIKGKIRNFFENGS